MSNLDLNKSTTTNFTDNVPDFIVDAKTLDVANDGNGETYIYYPEAPARLGYYLQIPEIYSAINAMATWAFGAGWSSEDPTTQAELEHVTGMGKDTFESITWNHEVMKLVVGDAFMEVIRNKKGTLLNLLSISAERVKTVFKGSRIIRYEVWNGKKWVTKKPKEMIHSHNKRIGDNVRGVSQFAAATFVIDSKNEALADERTIKHRDKALGIVYYKTNNDGKIAYANTQIEKAVKNGEMVGLPEDTAEIKPYPSRSSEDRQSWILYQENFIYQVIGVPRSIATSDGTSEVGGKMGNVNFEPTYAKERQDMESDYWNQQEIKVIFEKQNSLGGLMKETEQKNTGQINIQPNDVKADMERE